MYTCAETERGREFCTSCVDMVFLMIPPAIKIQKEMFFQGMGSAAWGRRPLDIAR